MLVFSFSGCRVVLVGCGGLLWKGTADAYFTDEFGVEVGAHGEFAEGHADYPVGAVFGAEDEYESYWVCWRLQTLDSRME